MKPLRTKLLRVAAVAVVMALMICVAAAVSFAAQGKDDAKATARLAEIDEILSKIERRLAAIEERLDVLSKERGPGAFAITPRRFEAVEPYLREMPELRERLKERGLEFDVLKDVYRAAPGETYGGIGATMSSEDGGPVTITELTEGKPAAKAGLEPGDVILSVDGKSVKGMDVGKVAELIRGEPKTEVVLTIGRDGKEKKVAVTREQIGDRSMELFLAPKIEDFDFDFEFPEIEEEFIGIGVYLGASDEGRPMIDGVMEGSPAEDAGLRAGDVILSVDGKSVGSTEDAIELMGGGKKGEKVTLTIERGGKQKDVTITRGLIKRAASFENMELPALDVYKEALKGEKAGLKAYEQALKALEGADVHMDVLKAHPEAAEAYKKALQIFKEKDLKEKDLKLKEIPEGWVLHDDEDEDDDGDYDDNGDYDDDEDEDYDHEDFDGLVRKEIKVLSTGDVETTRSLMIKVGPDGKAHTFELKGGEWLERDPDDGVAGLKILRPDTDDAKRIILRRLNEDEHEIIFDGDDDHEGLIRKEVKVLSTGDREMTRSLMIKVGADKKAHTFELKGGECVEHELGDIDGCHGLEVVCPDGEEGKCIILRAPGTDDGVKVMQISGGDGAGQMKVRICPESGAPCTGKCMENGEGSYSWLDRPNLCDAAGPQFRVRRGSDGCDCACGEADPAPSAMSCTMECRAGACASGTDCNFFRTISDSGEVIILCRPKGSLTICEPGEGCCPN